jgi:hypothetical protein
MPTERRRVNLDELADLESDRARRGLHLLACATWDPFDLWVAQLGYREGEWLRANA